LRRSGTIVENSLIRRAFRHTAAEPLQALTRWIDAAARHPRDLILRRRRGMIDAPGVAEKEGEVA
jgi:hypothetical protein